MPIYNIPSPLDCLSEKVQKSFLTALEACLYDINNNIITLQDIQAIDDEYRYDILNKNKYYVLCFFGSLWRADNIDTCKAYYTDNIRRILGDPDTFFNSYEWQSPYQEIFSCNCKYRQTSAIGYIIRMILDEFFSGIKDCPHESILKNKPEQDILVIRNIWMAWEVNNITPHGYKSNSQWRIILFYYKDLYIRKAVSYLSISSENIKAIYNYGVLYFVVDGIYQVSFHVRSIQCDNIMHEKIEWIGFRTSINPLSISTDDIHIFNNYIRNAKYINEKYKLRIDESILGAIIRPDDIERKIKDKIKEIKTKYKISNKLKLRGDYNNKGLYFAYNNIRDDKQITKDKIEEKIYEMYPPIKYTKGTIDFYDIKKFKKSIKYKIKEAAEFYMKSSMTYMNWANEYKTKKSKKRINHENKSQEYKSISDDILYNIDITTNLIISFYRKIVKENKNRKIIEAANNELNEFYKNILLFL